MARQTEVLLFLILTTAAMTSANVENPQTEADFDLIVKEAEERQINSKCSTCCPFGWVKYERRCFTYQALSTTWAFAEQHCISLGGHLVSVHSENEHQVVKAVIRAHDPRENPTWIGLNGCQKRKQFFWSDGTKLTFTKWNPGEPNALLGECCVHTNYGSRKNWNDIRCAQKNPFVCAKSVY